jgi:tight adherence protein C
MTATPALGALLGLGLGLGLLLVAVRVPAARRPRLHDRLAPYVRPLAPRPLLLLETGSSRRGLATVEALVRPGLDRAAGRLGVVLGGAATLRVRLVRAGRDPNVQAFRVEQVLWAASALALALATGVVVLLAGMDVRPSAILLLCGVAALGGVVACDQRLSRQVSRREQRMLAELPTVADLLALAVTAGHTPLAALERVVGIGRGELVGELAVALDDVRLGDPLVGALDAVAERTGLVPLARFVDGIAVAVERGTPLADVLRAQAGDVRDDRRRALMEVGGRKEVAMLVPVVFLMLPITVLFALYPGFVQIQAVAP